MSKITRDGNVNESQEESSSELGLAVQLAKHLILFAISAAALAACVYVLYVKVWVPLVGLGPIAFALAFVLLVIVAYKLGWMPAIDELLVVVRRLNDRARR
jgi:hypothetical protein